MKSILFTSIAGGALLFSGLAFGQNNVSNNSSFETWHNYTVITPTPLSLSAPNSWHGTDSLVGGYAIIASAASIHLNPQKQVYKSTESHSGQAAVQLFSKNLGDVGVQPGSISNAAIDVNIGALANMSQLFSALQFKGGESISGNVASVSAWMKNGDSAHTNNYFIMAMTVKDISQDSFVVTAQGTKSISPNLTQYTQETVDLQTVVPGLTPNRLVVLISSGDISDSNVTQVVNNSVLVDDVQYTLGTNGIKIPLMTSNEMLVYPVPAKDLVYFNLKSQLQPSDYNLRITDVMGRVISQEKLSQQINSKDVSNWARGMYFYQLTNLKTNQQQTGKFTLE